MGLERLIGFTFTFGILIIVFLFVLSPQIDYQQDQKILEKPLLQENISDNSPEITISENPVKDNQDLNISSFDKENLELDLLEFDLFVIRVHVLSSLEGAEKIVVKINNSGFPAFIEPFGKEQNLFAVYVGPFIEKNDIEKNLKQIYEASDTSKGEISRWKL